MRATRILRAVRAVLVAFLLIAGVTVPRGAQPAAAVPIRHGTAAQPSPDSGRSVHHGTLPSLGSVPPKPQPTAPYVVPPRGPAPQAPTARIAGPAPRQHTAPHTTAIPFTADFDGISAGRASPPDPNAAVGLDQVAEVVNLSFAVYSKTGATLLAPEPTNTLWTGFGGTCENKSSGDAVVRWDVLARRWVVTQLAFETNFGPFLECVAVSTTPDATGGWEQYAFEYATFNDYPKLSVWPDGYYVTYNMNNDASPQGHFVYYETCAMDRAGMLAGAATVYQVCHIHEKTGFGVLAADLDSATPPPAGEPELLVGRDGDVTSSRVLYYWRFKVDWTHLTASVTGPFLLPVAPYTVACPDEDADNICVPQADTGQLLDTVSAFLMQRAAYRNFGSYESLVVNHSVQVGDSVGVRWYELRLPRGKPALYQQGTYAPDGTYRWMGSLAEDRKGDIALGYSQSSATTHPSIRFTARREGDPPGAMTLGETTVLTGGGSQVGIARWGDYTSMAIDPVDDCTFWYTNEYVPTNGRSNWRTRLTAFQLPGCAAPAHGTGLTADPAIIRVLPPTPYIGRLSATLSDSATGQPITGQNVVFTTGRTTLCTSATDARGVAVCQATLFLPLIVLGGGYTAAYAGNAAHLGATAHGGLISLVGRAFRGQGSGAG